MLLRAVIAPVLPLLSRHVARAAVLLGLLVHAAPAHATVTQGLELPALTAQSHSVVLGRVVRSVPQWDSQGMRIFTAHTVEVTSSLKGAPVSTVTVMTWGGTVDGVGQVVLGEAALQPGDEAVFFLEQGPVPGALRVVGLAQGVWPVSHGPRGVLWASRKASRLVLRVPGQAAGTFATVADPGVPAVTVEDLAAQVRLLSGVAP